MLIEPGNQFTITRAALSTSGRARNQIPISKFLSVVSIAIAATIWTETVLAGTPTTLGIKNILNYP